MLASVWSMRVHIFVTSILMLALGGVALGSLERKAAFELLEGALMLGGGLLICGLFTLKMQWHGIIGAGVLALLGAARGIGNLPGLFRFASGDQSRGIAPALELAFTVMSLALLFKVMKALQQERTRRILETPEEP